MKVEELKNYGKGFMDIMSDPGLMKTMIKVMLRELRQELGLIGMIRLMRRMRQETNRMRKHDWSRLTERGINREFLDWLIQSMAGIKALVDMVGMEKASGIYRRMWDKVAYDLVALVFPPVEELKACGDSFEAFKEYMKAFNAVSEHAWLHEFEIVEDTDNVFACNSRYCAWHEVAKEFGDPYLCYPSSCYSDEVWIPRMGAQVGFQFKRTGTLSTGAPVCDFRFERIASGESK